jgi:hypothetical protein
VPSIKQQLCQKKLAPRLDTSVSINNNIIILILTTTIMENRTKASTNQQLHCYHQQGARFCSVGPPAFTAK